MRRRIQSVMNLSARDYVQDGLVAMWDGIENVGWGKHDASSTVWKDLIGSKNITLGARAYWGENFLGKDGSVGWFGYGSSSAINWVSAEICTRPITGTKDTGVFLYNCQQFGNIILMTTIRPAIYTSSTSSTRPTLDFKITNNKDTTISFVTSNESLSYGGHDGSKVTATTTHVFGWPIRQVFGLGAFSETDADYPYSGYIYSFRLYNRQLTASEIAANYAIDKARFGLS